MALINNLQILNGADKARHYAVAIGEGAPTDVKDPIITDVRSFQVGSQYTDLTGKAFYIRVAVSAAAADWVKVGTTA